MRSIEDASRVKRHQVERFIEIVSDLARVLADEDIKVSVLHHPERESTSVVITATEVDRLRLVGKQSKTLQALFRLANAMSGRVGWSVMLHVEGIRPLDR